MRIAALATSAVLLSGCSWLGIGQNSSDSWADYNRGAQAAGRYQGAQHSPQPRGYAPQQRGYGAQAPTYGRCEITSVSMPVPQGCSPEQVTIALPGGQYGGAYGQSAGGYGQTQAQSQYQAPAAGSYGRSLGDINRAQAAANQGFHKSWTRPRFRLTGTTGFETSVSGDAYNSGDLPELYDPLLHVEATGEGSEADGQTILNVYEPRIDNVPGAENQSPSISISDLYAAPFTLGAGAEYQLNDRFAAFANASYSAARGRNTSGATYEADVHELTTTTNYIEDPATPGSFIENGAPILGNTAVPDIIVAKTSASVNDMRRTNLEVGGRYYFKDVFTNHLERPLNPYISASAGAAHYNQLEVSQQNEQLLLAQFWADPADVQYSREGSSAAVEVLEKGWVPTGAITVGAEWQVTPKAALAFETGIRYEGGRSITAGGETDGNIAIPLTLRGSIGF